MLRRSRLVVLETAVGVMLGLQFQRPAGGERQRGEERMAMAGKDKEGINRGKDQGSG